MKTNLNISSKILHFSRWSRKGYAIFAALGRQVHISGLSIGICVYAMLKSAVKGLIISNIACYEICFQLEKVADQTGIHTGSIAMEGEECADGLAYSAMN